MLNTKVLKLFNLPQPPQRTKEWFVQRNKQITASEVASCLFLRKEVIEVYNNTFPKTVLKENPSKGANNYETLDEYIKKKCNVYYSNNYEPFKDTIYTLHGKLYEPVATRFYSIYKKSKVNDFGLITHNKFKWLAASPDGITDEGTMLEIKCPLSRKINKESIPFGYWLQTQIQMEVCDLDECDFLECEISSITETEFFDLDESVIADGLAGIIIEKETKENKTYEYPDKETITKDMFKEFIKNENNKIYYMINNWNIINIKRSKEWFKNVKNDLYNVYKRIQKYQNDRESYNRYLETFNGPLYKKSLITLDKREVEFTEDILIIDIEDVSDSESSSSDQIDVEMHIECSTDVSVSCNISYEIDI